MSRHKANRDPKRKRWWQFSLRTFAIVVALLGLLTVLFLRCRQWGRELDDHRDLLAIPVPGIVRSDGAIAPPDAQWVAEQERELKQFDRRYWLPLKIYDLTRDWEGLERPIDYYDDIDPDDLEPLDW